NYMRDVLFPAGYVEVKTPLIYNKALWERSGHWGHYRENMFLIESEGEAMSLKPMNCPGHFLTYASITHSYRDLPVRFHEQTPLQDALARARRGLALRVGDGARCAPKLGCDVTGAMGRTWQSAATQLDYQQPGNFGLTRLGADNDANRPVVIHRAIFGKLE